MSVGSVRGKDFFEKIGYEKESRVKERERTGFAGNFKGKAQETEGAQADPASVQKNARFGAAAAPELFLRGMGRVNQTAVKECSVRRIGYDESDYVKVFPAEGYLIKAKADLKSRMVYIERKNEDGTYQAYEVNPMQISEHSKNPLTQAALEAWCLAKEKENNGEEPESETDSGYLTEFQKRLLEFEAYVKERIKDGPPKIMIGGAEFSEEEWEKLIRKIDEDIDAYKEELRERIQKQKEAEALKETEEQESVPQRGSSLLARISGTKKAPYSYLADETGKIVYKGVTFFCDDKKQQICLGDMSDTKNVISIPLSKGGCLKVNRDNISDLAKAISMFSAEDIGRIMRAIAKDNKLKEVEWELEASKGGI